MAEVLMGIPVSKGNLKKLRILDNKLEAKEFLEPKRVFPIEEITAWSEVIVIQKPGNFQYYRLTIFTQKKKSYSILSLHWKNYDEIKNKLIKGKNEVEEPEKKILGLIVIIIISLLIVLGIVFFSDSF